MGVLQTTVAEIVKVKAQQRKSCSIGIKVLSDHRPARAYSIMPFVWCLGSVLASLATHDNY